MIFKTTKEDEKKINDWLDTIHSEIIKGLKIFYVEKRKMSLDQFNKLTNNGKDRYYGSIGGGLTYIFLPTNIDISLTVRESITGEELKVF